MKSTTKLFRVVLGCAIAFAACGALELTLVLVGFAYPPLDSPIVVELPDDWMDSGGIHTRDAACLWRPAPGARIPWGIDERVNSDGYRGPLLSRERTPGVMRIVTLGDSSTFGHSVAYADCFSARLAVLLAERTGKPVEVLDAGVIGYTVRQGLERWRVFAREYEPDIVIGAFGAVNEHIACMGLPDDELMRTRAHEASAGVRWARRLRTDLRLAHVAGYVSDALHGGRAAMLRRDREHELAIRPSLAGVVEVDWPGVRRVSLDEFDEFSLTLRDEVRATGSRYIALSLPRRIEVTRKRPVLLEYSRRLEAMAARGEFEFVDGHIVLGRAIRPDVWPKDLLIDAFHPSPLGHAALAEALAEAVMNPPTR